MDRFDIVVNIFIEETGLPAHLRFFFLFETEGRLKGERNKDEETSKFVPRHSKERRQCLP